MGGLSNVVQEWKNASPGGKALAITAVIAVAGLGLYTATRNTGSSSTPNVSLLPIGSDSSSTLSSPSPTDTTTSPVSNLIGIVRAKGTAGNYDIEHKGVPLRLSSNAGSSDLVDIPFGTQLSIIGSAIYDSLSPQGTSVWYKVSYNGQTGYVSAFDLPNVFPQGTYNGGPIMAPAIGTIKPAPSIQVVPMSN